jgi:hypothetical protein
MRRGCHSLSWNPVTGCPFFFEHARFSVILGVGAVTLARAGSSPETPPGLIRHAILSLDRDMAVQCGPSQSTQYLP